MRVRAGVGARARARAKARARARGDHGKSRGEQGWVGLRGRGLGGR